MKNLFPKTKQEFKKFLIAFFAGELTVFALLDLEGFLKEFQVQPKAAFLTLFFLGGLFIFCLLMFLGFALWYIYDKESEENKKELDS